MSLLGCYSLLYSAYSTYLFAPIAMCIVAISVIINTYMLIILGG